MTDSEFLKQEYYTTYCMLIAGSFLVDHLKSNRIVLANQASALKTAKRNLQRYKKEEHKAYVAIKAHGLITHI